MDEGGLGDEGDIGCEGNDGNGNNECESEVEEDVDDQLEEVAEEVAQVGQAEEETENHRTSSRGRPQRHRVVYGQDDLVSCGCGCEKARNVFVQRLWKERWCLYSSIMCL